MKQTRKKHFRRNKWNIAWFVSIVLVIMTLEVLTDASLFKFSSSNLEFQSDLLKVSSVFAGFLYTSMGIMAGMIDKERINKLNKGGYLDNYFNAIYISISFQIMVIIISVIIILRPSIADFYLVITIEHIFLILGIAFFVKSVWNVISIIEKVRNS
ncbi:hypothetical protein [Marininema halotolerans]|uniref:Uncharacterized protein n=1 Tax=Marininema halotolerans TaxID=1155944 RepID=A0A1I6QJ38_9BACL|nr:hypothetical protein [Marininema halotolerans]SFS52422.1 hypothetical protein SAMN05444972_103182 [Marininema halotolerans]